MIKIIDAYYNVNAKNFQDLFKKINLDLINKNYVNKDFLQNIINREKKYPTGLLFDGISVSIPHTDSEFVKKSGIIAIKTSCPIQITHMATKDKYLNVQFLFLLLVSEMKMQPQVLSDLITNFKNKKFQEKIIKIKNKSQLLQIFE